MTISREEQIKIIEGMSDEDIVYDEDSPHTDASFWLNADVILPERRVKELKSMRFDPELYQWYEETAKKMNVPTQYLMHQVLESWRKHQADDR